MNPHAAQSLRPTALLRSFHTNRSLIFNLIKREVVGRYRGSVMGLLWSFFNPVFLLVVYTFVFSVVFRARWLGGSDSKVEFALVLFTGLLVYNRLCCKFLSLVREAAFSEQVVDFMSAFKGRHFSGEVVLWAVRWYCRYGISYRDLEQMMAERGVRVDHATIYRWVQTYAPEMEKRLRWQWRRPVSGSWRVDETYIKVRGKWTYLYRAVDKLGNTIDFYLSPTRNTKAAKRFLGKALRGLKDWEKPHTINTDKAPAYGAAISELKAEGKCPEETEHRQVKYLNNVVEADHGKLKQLIRPVRGFKTLKSAYATIKGFEVMRALRKGQAGIFNFSNDVLGEARIVERAFGIGSCALSEAVTMLENHLQDVKA